MKTKQYYVGNDAHIGIGVLLEVYKAMGGRASITSIKNLWIDIVEGRHVTFHENYCTDLTQSYPTARVKIKARGQVDHVIPMLSSLTAGRELSKLG